MMPLDLHTPPSVKWNVVIPFKGSHFAKSRLSLPHGSYPPVVDDSIRLQLARAFLEDTVAAALAVRRVAQVIVVSSDRALRSSLKKIDFVDDPSEGLNAAISAGVAHARILAAGNPVAVLTGDLPGLAPKDLEVALQAAEDYPLSMVADHAFSGTTMITGLPGTAIEPKFGLDSHKRHIQGGYRSLAVSLDSTLRHDVDTPADLAQALRNGVGTATANVIDAVSQHMDEEIGYTELPLERTQ